MPFWVAVMLSIALVNWEVMLFSSAMSSFRWPES
jgi:hypothetical protein